MRIYNKLVRDNIPEIIKSNGETAHISVLDDNEYFNQLKIKLTEEVNEFLESEELMELADIIEVVEYLAKANNSTLDKVLRMKNKKALSNGGFEKKIFLEFVEE